MIRPLFLRCFPQTLKSLWETSGQQKGALESAPVWISDSLSGTMEQGFSLGEQEQCNT